jgi:hypothetical protein
LFQEQFKVCDDEICLPGVVDVSFEGVIEGEERLRFGDLEPVLKVDDIWNETSMMKSLNIIEVICTEKKYDEKLFLNIIEVICTENKYDKKLFLNIIEVICFGNKYDKKFIFNILEVISTENKE